MSIWCRCLRRPSPCWSRLRKYRRVGICLCRCALHEQADGENTINKALRVIGYDTKTEVCGHGFRTMACSALNESALWSKDAIERQMSHKERNGVRAAYVHRQNIWKPVWR